jgi:large repetitive protein
MSAEVLIAVTRKRRRTCRFSDRGKASRKLFFEPLEDRRLLAAVPAAMLTVPSSAFIGDAVNFSVAFDNTSATDTGYGPFVDLIMPNNGADGAASSPQDGLTFNNATYLGLPVTSMVLTFPAGTAPTCVDHPYAVNNTGAPLQVCGSPGDQLVVLQLPFGSFTPSQPPAVISVTASMSNFADLGTSLPIKTRAGFQFGNTPLNDYTTDPTIISADGNNSNSSTWTNQQSVTPTLITLEKSYNGPEDETATGPNFPRRYTITVEVAPGQTLTNLDVTDLLPNNLAFLSVISTSPAGASVLQTPTAGGAANPPNNALVVRFPTVTGGAGADATVTFEYFVPRVNANATSVIDPTTGTAVISENEASAVGNWAPLDPRDASGTGNAVANPPGPEHVLNDRSLAVQKTVAVKIDTGAAGPTPDDTLEYTLNFQVSDFFAFQNVSLKDILSDGQRFDPSFPPTLTVTEDGSSSSGSMNASHYSVITHYTGGPSPVAPIDGTQELQFRVSDELVARGGGLDALLLGGCVPHGGTGGPAPDCSAYNAGPTIGTIVFRAIIQRDYTDIHGPPFPHPVVQFDRLSNGITVRGDVLNNSNLTPTDNTVTDTSGAGVTIVKPNLAKTIYAVNGSTSFASPVVIGPGDDVTYRLTSTMPISRFEQGTLIDYLPLPVFDATTVTTFDPTVSAAAPAPGGAKFGPTDTFSALSLVVPTMTTDATSNSVQWFYGDYAANPPQQTIVDLLFTVTATNIPFADGLFLTNQVRLSSLNASGDEETNDQIIQIQLGEPVLAIQKGVVATNKATAAFTPTPAVAAPLSVTAPGSSGFRFAGGSVSSQYLAGDPRRLDSNLSGIDAGDLVTFVMIVENTGSSRLGAFDVSLADTLPPGFRIPTAGESPNQLNLQVTDGTGAAIAFTDLGGGLFGTGIQLTDPGPTPALPDPDRSNGGALDQYNATNGRNVAIITYDLIADVSAQPGQTITNTATLTGYAGTEGGPNFLSTGLTDPASATIALPTAAKTLKVTSEASTADPSVAIGEVVRYRLQAGIPEGTSVNLRLVDLLPPGLQFLNDNTAKVAFVADTPANMTSTTLSGAGLVVAGDDSSVGTITPTFVLSGTAISPATFSSGTDPVFSLGTIVNAESDSDTEYVVLEFNALVNNNANTNNGEVKSNQFQVQTGLTPTTLVTSNTVDVTIREPVLTETKTLLAPVPRDAGDTASYRVVYTNTGGTTAFEILLTDTLPGDLTLNVPSVTVTPSGGAAGVTNTSSGNTVNVLLATIPVGGSVTVTYTATVNNSIAPGQTIQNTALVTYTSLPGSNGTTSNPTGSATPGGPGDPTGERTGTGTAPNDYRISRNASFTAALPTPVKSIAATSETSTSGSNVAIGEIVRYRLQVGLPEGTSVNLRLNDQLPNGLQFLNDGTAKVALVADDVTKIASSTLSGAGLQIAGDDGTVGSIVPTFVVPASAINAPPFVSGTDPIFSLGTITNFDDDSDTEYVVLEFNALVSNNSSTNNGSNLSNSFLVQTGLTPATIATSNSLPVTVREPVLVATKTIDAPAPQQAGDLVAYRVTYPNTGGTAAFDVRLIDTLPAKVALDLASVTVTLSGGASGSIDASAGNTVDVTVATIPVGGSVTITFTGTLLVVVTPGETIGNAANLTYTSLPGANGTTVNPTGSATPGIPGAPDGERTGSGIAPNDYLSTGSVNFTTPLSAAVKSIVATSETSTSLSDVAIGEIVRYRLQAELLQGTLPYARLRR